MASAVDTINGPGGTNVALTLAKDAYQRATTKLATKRSQTLQQYGYKATGYDAQGNPTGMSVDQFNPYGEYQTMLHDSALASMQASDSAAERGLFGGGLANQAESELQWQHGQRSYEMGRALTSAFTDIQSQQMDAEQQYAQAQWEANRQAALDAIAKEQFEKSQAAAAAAMAVQYPTNNDPYPWPDPVYVDPNPPPPPPPVVIQPTWAAENNKNPARGTRGIYKM